MESSVLNRSFLRLSAKLSFLPRRQMVLTALMRSRSCGASPLVVPQVWTNPFGWYRPDARGVTQGDQAWATSWLRNNDIAVRGRRVYLTRLSEAR